jgi:hypothetical protein
LENGTKPIKLAELAYPVFRLGTEKPIFTDGVVLYYRQYIIDDESKETYHIIDDTTIDKPTLALRRIELLKMGVKLQKLSRATFFLSDFIKLADRSTWFIDSNGQVFQYKKHKWAKLTFKKVKYVIPIKTGGAIIEVEGVPGRFKTLYVPDPSNRYAGLIIDGMGYILYGMYPEQLKDSRRMI